MAVTKELGMGFLWAERLAAQLVVTLVELVTWLGVRLARSGWKLVATKVAWDWMLAAWKAELKAANWVWMVGLSVAMMGAWAEKMVERKASMVVRWVVMSASSMGFAKAHKRAAMTVDQTGTGMESEKGVNWAD